MAYKKHPRHITKEQFADNTTVDGDRIDSAMESFERHINEVPEGDVLTKWTPTMFVAGWIPQSATPSLAMANNAKHFRLGTVWNNAA